MARRQEDRPNCNFDNWEGSPGFGFPNTETFAAFTWLTTEYEGILTFETAVSDALLEVDRSKFSCPFDYAAELARREAFRLAEGADIALNPHVGILEAEEVARALYAIGSLGRVDWEVLGPRVSAYRAENPELFEP